VLRDVDTSLAGWLSGYLPLETEIVYDTPVGRDPLRPALGLYLHEVREEGEVTPADWSEIRGENGLMLGRLPPQRRYRLTYLVTAWAASPLDEHELLGRVLAGCAAHYTIPSEHVTGVLAETSQALMVRCAPFDRACDPRELWAAWRIPPRTALELSVLVPMPVAMLTDIPLPPRKMAVSSSRPPEGERGFTPPPATEWPPPRRRLGISE
jgi:Pvc16 N-terminal domain